MAYLFRTPTRLPEGDRLPTVPNPQTDFDDGQPGPAWSLMRHVHRDAKPVAVLISGTVVTEHYVLNQTDADAATWVYQGGRDYIVSATERALLQGAGYTVLDV